MNKTALKISSALLVLAFSSFAIACDYPQRAELPNGATASKDEMLAGQKSVKDYMAAMEEYLTCIESDEQESLAGIEDVSEEERSNREDALTKKYNAGVEEMELLAARFNEEVRAYRAQDEE